MSFDSKGLVSYAGEIVIKTGFVLTVEAIRKGIDTLFEIYKTQKKYESMTKYQTTVDSNKSENRINEHHEKTKDDIIKDTAATDNKIRYDDARTDNEIRKAKAKSQIKMEEMAFAAELKKQAAAEKADEQEPPLSTEAEQEEIDRIAKPHDLNEPQTEEEASRPYFVQLSSIDVKIGGITLISAFGQTGKSIFTMGRCIEYARKRPSSKVLVFETEYNEARNNERYDKHSKPKNLNTFDGKIARTDVKEKTRILVKAIRQVIDKEAAFKSEVFLAIDNITEIASSPTLYHELKKLRIEFERQKRILTILLVVHPKANQRTPLQFRVKDIECRAEYSNFADAIYAMLKDPKDKMQDSDKRILIKLSGKDGSCNKPIWLHFTKQPYIDLVPMTEAETESVESPSPRKPGRPQSADKDERARQVLKLYNEGLKKAEIARKMNVDQTIVKRLLDYAHKKWPDNEPANTTTDQDD